MDLGFRGEDCEVVDDGGPCRQQNPNISTQDFLCECALWELGFRVSGIRV